MREELKNLGLILLNKKKIILNKRFEVQEIFSGVEIYNPEQHFEFSHNSTSRRCVQTMK